MKLSNFLLFSFTIFISSSFFAQRGKNLDYTVTAANTVVNTYTALTANASTNNTSITVTSNTLNGAQFSSNLAQGDLILIIQMQGAGVLIDWWNGQPSISGSTGVAGMDPSLWYQNAHLFGQIDNYYGSGLFEMREVLSVTGGATINLTCGLVNSYDATKHTQVIRVPRFNDLTLNANTSIIPTIWNGTTGGVIAIEVNGDLELNNNSFIDASAAGFRGGATQGTSFVGGTTAHTYGDGNGNTPLGHMNEREGGAKGESIGGFTTEYSDVFFYSVFGRGAIANGGGGGGYQNAGGGGGSNVGTGTYTGKGIPTPGYVTFWNLELAGFATSNSPGGGRGGYSLAQSDQNESVVGPNTSSWMGDARKENGGYGGHPLTFSTGRLFMGGGGGAGGQDSGQGGSGGRGGGIVFMDVYGAISGTGAIRANGQNGFNSNPTSANATVVNTTRGNDGAGGGGGGGFIRINNMNPIPASISLIANGGEGGDQDLRYFSGSANETGGPGAGGAGGGIAFTSGTPTQSINGGTSGITLRNTVVNSMMSQFPPNGATNGGNGLSSLSVPMFNIIAENDTICGNQSASLTASIVGTSPGGSLQWFANPFGGAVLASGNTYNTPVIGTTTTYYVGICPGTFRVPVTVVVGQNPIISGTANITNVTCNSQGSITGLTASVGVAPLEYTWNGVVTADGDLINAAVGNYTLTVTDDNGCSSQSGPYSITGVGGPIISGTVVITNATCTENGSITGLTASGTETPFTFEWNGVSSLDEDLPSAVAGSYTLVVTDDNGCTAQSGPHVIETDAGPSIQGLAVIQDETCTSNGTITGLSTTGGLQPYTFTWNGVPSTDENLSASAGSYTLEVTDDNGCTASSGPYTIDLIAGPVISGTAIITDVTCNALGGITGLTANGGVAPLEFAWNGVVTVDEDLTDAIVGDYTLVVTDDNGCTTQSGPYTISGIGGPVISGTLVITDATCTENGSITGLTASGTETPFTFEWNSVASADEDLPSAPAGDYTLVVTDDNGCTSQSGPHTIGTVAGPTILGVAVVTNATCTENGSITGLTINGGVPNYTIEWNGNTSVSMDVSDVPAGNYTVEVTDDNGCTVQSGPYVIGTDAGPTIQGVATITDATCTADGTITGLSATGGLAPYTFTWNGISSPDENLTAPAGNYTLEVTDDNGCIVESAEFTIGTTDGPEITGTAIETDATCTTLGSITGLTVTGGVGPIFMAWNGTVVPSEDLSNAPAGDYTFTVLDDNGCTAQSGPYTIELIGGPTVDVASIVISNETCDNQNGSITGISVSGGTPDYTFEWNGALSATLDITDLVAGDYTLTVTDDEGCTIDAGPFTITNIPAPTLNEVDVVVTNASCDGTLGSISGIITTGDNLSYSWSNGGGNSLNASNLNAGDYVLTVEDEVTGCSVQSATYSISTNEGPTIDDTDVLITNEICNGTLGTITGITANGIGNLAFVWTNTSQQSIDLTGLQTGSYSLIVTDDVTGCTATSGPYTVIYIEGPTADFTYNPILPVVDEEVQFTDQSSGTIISWNWVINTENSIEQNPTHVFNEDGVYIVSLTVVDQNGCSDVTSVEINVLDDLVIPNVITPNGDGVNDFFVIEGLVPNSQLVILNRWGNEVFNSSNYLNEWNGTDKTGVKLLEGVYTYILKSPDGNQKHGFVHLEL